MKTTRLLLALTALAAASLSAHAGSGIFGSSVAIDPDGPGGVPYTWYGAQQPVPGSLTDFNGVELGTFLTGDTAQIAGGEVLTYKNGGSDVTGAQLEWKIAETGPWHAVPLGFTSNSTFNDAGGNTFINPGDQKWAQISSTPNFIAGLGAGDYHLEVRFLASTSDGGAVSNNGGADYLGHFVVANPVPEPSSLALMLAGLGAVWFMGRRRGRN